MVRLPRVLETSSRKVGRGLGLDGFAKELDPFAFLPFSLLLLCGLGVVLNSNAVHVVFLEGAHVGSAIGVGKSTNAMFHSLGEVACVKGSIFGSKLALTFELAFEEVTLVGLFLVSHELHTTAMECTVHHLTVVVAAVSPFETTSPIFLSACVGAFKSDCTIFPLFATDTVLAVI